MQQLKGAGILAPAIALGACTNDGATPDVKATSSNSSQPASLDREPPAFAAFVPPPQKAAALAAWREASFGLFSHFGVNLIRDLGPLTKIASSFMIMALIGGAISPPLVSHMADVTGSLQTALVIPLAGFCVVLAYGLSGHK